MLRLTLHNLRERSGTICAFRISWHWEGIVREGCGQRKNAPWRIKYRECRSGSRVQLQRVEIGAESDLCFIFRVVSADASLRHFHTPSRFAVSSEPSVPSPVSCSPNRGIRSSVNVNSSRGFSSLSPRVPSRFIRALERVAGHHGRTAESGVVIARRQRDWP